jgi:hypothetical protein
MSRQFVLKVLVVILSVGWLVPAWLGLDTYLTFWQVEGWPLLYDKPAGNSFDFLGFSRSCLRLSAAWLAVALCFWSYLGFTAFTTRPRA